MSFESTDLAFFFTGSGGPGDDRENNKGGAISATEIVHSQVQNFAPDISRTVVGAIGSTGTWSVYFPFYIKNKHASITVTDVKMTIYKNTSHPTSVSVQMGFDPAGKNGTCQTIANQTTAPTGVTFSNPVTVIIFNFTQTTVWNVASSMAAGDRVPLWIRLFGPKGSPSIPTVSFGLKATFVRPA